MVVYDDMVGLIDPYGDIVEISAIIENGWVFMVI
jgi:hypothetical protein